MGAGGPFHLPLRNSLVSLLTGRLRRGGHTGIARLLRPVRDAVHADALADAMRHLDRAWRALPDEAGAIAPLYARLLMLEGRDFTAALRLAELSLELAPDPDIAATRIGALLGLGRFADARECLEAALADYCVVPEGALERAADEVMRHAAIDAPGWVGVAPTLELVYRLAPPRQAAELHVRVEDRRRMAYWRDIPLLGSGARLAEDFALDGRTHHAGRRVTSWVRLGWLPTRAPRLRFADGRRGRVDVQPKGPPEPGWRWTCTLDLGATTLRGERIHVAAQLPDGRWHALPDSPLLLRAPRPPRPTLAATQASPVRASPARRTRSRTSRAIDIIIPVYGNREESLACIESALHTAGATARLVVVDDAGEDPELGAALDALARAKRITLLRNAVNLGFAGAVNRGLAHDPDRDAVLLNSDTRVFGDWLARLKAAAYSDATVGTVTPLSNNGSIASYPEAAGNDALAPEGAEALDALAAATNRGRRVAIPVGVGFCLYLRRDCLNAVGNLDAAVFGKGYGEETDLCLRARAQGFTNLLAADVYVSHAGGLTFGARRAALLERSQRLLNLRHPGYDRSILRFLAQDPVHAVRRSLDAQRLRAHAGRKVLIVTLALEGGVGRFVKERCRHLAALGITPLVLKPAKPEDSTRCALSSDELNLPNLHYDIPGELPALVELLRALSFEAIEIQHFLHLDARVIEAVRALPAPCDVFVHDYAWLCPRVTLIDGSGRYCGEPAVTVCETCVKRHGSNLGEDLSVKSLRARSAGWLRAARRVIAPSEDTAARLRRHFDGLDVEVRPHGVRASPQAKPPARATPPASPAPRTPRTPVRVALIGAIGAHKGYDVLLACARDARKRRLNLEFVVIGYTENDAPLLATGRVFITGPYIDGEAPHLIARERPDFAWLPSVWPETWCYTLDHALAVGLPVAAFDLGAIAERLRAMPESKSLLLPPQMKSQRINDALLDFVIPERVAARAAMNSVKSLPAPRRRMASIDELQLRGMNMVKPSNGRGTSAAPEPGLSASVQVLPLTAGLYLFSVKEARPQASAASGELRVPAMHVGLGPGVHSEQVEFISSPSTHGAWLFAASDLLVTRINGKGATLILTSVRAPTGDVLSIKVERLDARAAATESTERAQPVAAAPEKPAPAPKPAFAPLSTQILTHVSTRGDLIFLDAPWAGRVAPGLWIESFAVLPLEHLSAHDIEYKGLTGSGFETPWLSDNAACGTKGMGIPLVGFAVRLRPGTHTAGYDCEYSGYFQSGLTIGPLRNGAPCRSSVANDPLEGIQVRLVKRPGSGANLAAPRLPATGMAHAPAAARGTRVNGNGHGNGNGNGNGRIQGGHRVNETSRVNGVGNRKTATAKAKVAALAADKPGRRTALAR